MLSEKEKEIYTKACFHLYFYYFCNRIGKVLFITYFDKKRYVFFLRV